MNKRFRHIVAIISTLWALVLASTATPLLAQSAPDWPVAAGHFYTQASGVPDPQLGFAITNGDGVSFWDEYQRWGGPAALGYPITNRFRQDGFWVQATERFLLQWNPQAERVDFVNVMDRLSDEGHDTFLFLARQIPEPDTWPEETGLTEWEIVQNRLSVLADNPDISAAYWSGQPSALVAFGLPTSRVVDQGNVVALRTQRAVLQLWKVTTPWAQQGEVTVNWGSQLAREAGAIPGYAAQPLDDQAALLPAEAPVTVEAGTFPRTVVDATGQAHYIRERPQRIVSLMLGADEILLSLVDRDRIAAVTYLAANSIWTNVAAQAQGMTTVGTDPEQIAALQPDIVFAATYTNPDSVKLLKDLGYRVITMRLFDSVGRIEENIRFVAEVVGEETRGETLVAQLEARLQEVEAAVAQATSKPRVLFYSSFGTTAGIGSTGSDIIERAGGINVAAEAGIGPFGSISLEKVVELNPDVIIMDEYTPDNQPRWREEFVGHPALATVNAVKNKQTYVIPAKHMTAVSQFIAEAVYDMAQVLHPDLVRHL